ncbi:MAG TPA: thermonuclease family protein [Dongiaceae bacterium]|nr:thermonuclease family protein [Dongiaceae bacterium]
MNRLLTCAIAVALCALNVSASAQNDNVAPAPPAVPIGQVGQAPLAPAGGPTIEGMATVIDGDELRIGDRLVRLFGIAAPDISADHGPNARVYLDGLAGGQRVICREVDRGTDHESIAVCTIDGTDLAPELLSQGLAAVYRVGTQTTAQERELAARYDTEEADARERKLGIWAPREAAPPAAPATMSSLVQAAVPKWIEQAPLLGLILVLGIIALALLARRPPAHGAGEDPVDERVLAATLLAEVSAIRDSAQEQYDGTATLIQDMPIPHSHLGLLSLPRAVVFGANADRLDLLPGDLAARLVRFYAMHDGAAHLLGQAANVRCDVVRASLQGLTRSAGEVLGAG